MRKRCTQCCREKSLDCYNRNKNSPDGHLSVCRNCRQKNDRRYHDTNREVYLLKKARTRAKRKGFEFSIDINDIVIPKVCPVLKIPIVMEHDGDVKNGSPSLDRIDSSKGYIKGNVRVISYRANVLKNNATLDEMRLLVRDAQRISRKANPQPSPQ